MTPDAGPTRWAPFDRASPARTRCRALAAAGRGPRRRAARLRRVPAGRRRRGRSGASRGGRAAHGRRRARSCSRTRRSASPVLLYRHGDMAGSDAALTSAYEAVRDAAPSRTKTTVLGLVARAALERGDADRSLRLAREAEATAPAGTGSRYDVAAYAGRQVGMAKIALGDLDGLARISDPIPELERKRLLSAAAVPPLRPGRHPDRARPPGRGGHRRRRAAGDRATWMGADHGGGRGRDPGGSSLLVGRLGSRQAAADLAGGRSSAQAVVPQAWPTSPDRTRRRRHRPGRPALGGSARRCPQNDSRYLVPDHRDRATRPHTGRP